jgi:hypothetical protein
MDQSKLSQPLHTIMCNQQTGIQSAFLSTQISPSELNDESTVKLLLNKLVQNASQVSLKIQVHVPDKVQQLNPSLSNHLLIDYQALEEEQI